MVQKNTTPVHVDAYDSKRMTFSERLVNQVDPAAASNIKNESISWWNRFLGCQKTKENQSPKNENQSCNCSESKGAVGKRHKFKKLRWWVWCRWRPQQQSCNSSHQDTVNVCESLPKQKQRMHVSFKEYNKTTRHTDLGVRKADWGPKQNPAIVQNLTGEKEHHLGNVVRDDLAHVNNRKSRWWQWHKRCQVAPNPNEQCHRKQSRASSHYDKPVVLGGLGERKKNYNQTIEARSIASTLPFQHFKYLGLPNPAQICYMNASLQSLLTLEDFVEGINSQRSVWSSSPEAALIRSFMKISECHSSSNIQHKIGCLYSFKDTVSVLAPEFEDLRQKDAHEFLTSVLDQMRNLKPAQQKMAATIGKAYKCPVEEHFVFKMQNIRVCLRCNITFTREEEFTNLSLDLIPGCGTVEEMLQNYLTKTQVEFQCECGSNVSWQKVSFISLPKVLVLHLKRFVFFSVFGSMKVRRPICLSKDMMLPSKQGGACYSLVSIINHNGLTTSNGHYISDGVDPAVKKEDPTDRWFTYNDLDVQETSCASVCDKRQTTAYVLFYRRHD